MPIISLLAGNGHLFLCAGHGINLTNEHTIAGIYCQDKK